jgi:hypothetical protein
LLLAWLERERPRLVGRADAARLRRELRAALGARGSVSDRYLVATCEAAGYEVAADLGGVPAAFRALLEFDTLSGAEAALGELEARRGQAEDACRRAARRARDRAALIARNPRVHPRVRQEREEIAQWFTVWLQNPAVFSTWLELRKQSPEFLERFVL